MNLQVYKSVGKMAAGPSDQSKKQTWDNMSYKRDHNFEYKYYSWISDLDGLAKGKYAQIECHDHTSL